MSRRKPDTVTFPELFELPVTVPLSVAARAFDMSMATAYRKVADGTFPCETIRVGNRHKVPVAELMRRLGVECVSVHLDDVEAGMHIAR